MLSHRPPVTLGNYPEVSLAEARRQADTLRPRVRAGANPNEERRLAREAARAARRQARLSRASGVDTSTLRGLLDAFEAQKARPAKLRSWPNARRAIETNFAALLSKPPAELVRADFRAVLQAAVRRGSPIAGKRAARYLSRVCNWSVTAEILSVNPARGLDLDELTQAERPRQRTLDDDEIRAVWGVDLAPFADFARVLLLTALRRDELAGARWSDLQADTLVIPDTKSDRLHRLPLSVQALQIVNRQPRRQGVEFIFTDRGGGLDRPSTAWHRERLRLWAISGTANWTWHDLRRTARTTMARAGVDDLIAELILNHQLSGTLAKTYNTYKYQAEMKAALERLASFISEIVDGGAHKVVALRS